MTKTFCLRWNLAYVFRQKKNITEVYISKFLFYKNFTEKWHIAFTARHSSWLSWALWLNQINYSRGLLWLFNKTLLFWGSQRKVWCFHRVLQVLLALWMRVSWSLWAFQSIYFVLLMNKWYLQGVVLWTPRSRSTLNIGCEPSSACFHITTWTHTKKFNV